MQTALDASLWRVEVEGDNLAVARALQKSSRRLSYASTFVEKALSLSSYFQSVSFGHVSRTCNKVDHELAHLALLMGNEEVCMEEGRSSISTLVENDKPVTIIP